MSNYHDELRKGHETAKIRSHKQALITAFLQAIVISAAIFNEFPILVKILIFVVLQFILGIIMSSKWVQSKWKTSPKKNNQILSDVEHFLTQDMARKDPGGYEEASTAQFLKSRRLQKDQANYINNQNSSSQIKYPDDIAEEAGLKAIRRFNKNHSKQAPQNPTNQ